jgi:hypothetical protein
VINEKDAWNSFFHSGSVLDYLQYKSAQRASLSDGSKEEQDEIQDQRTDTQTAEYR